MLATATFSFLKANLKPSHLQNPFKTQQESYQGSSYAILSGTLQGSPPPIPELNIPASWSRPSVLVLIP